MSYIFHLKWVIKLWLHKEKILVVVFESVIKIALERSFSDNLAAFYNLSNYVKKLWLHSHVATTSAVHNCVTPLLKFYLECQKFRIGIMKDSSKHKCD